MRACEPLLGSACVLLAVFLVHHVLWPADVPTPGTPLPPASVQQASDDIPSSPPDTDTPPSRLAVAERTLTGDARRQIAPWLADGRYHVARRHLLDRAAAASHNHRPRLLGALLTLLGEVSIEARDFGAARLYLAEALTLFGELADGIGQAHVHAQLGHLHIRSRAVARHAGQAYDRLLLARFQLSRQAHDAAERNLRLAIDASIDIDRHATAASALVTLARLYRERGQVADAEQALLGAVRFHAASGRSQQAQHLLEQLQRAGVDHGRLHRARVEMARALRQYEHDTRQWRQAREYQSLYAYYRHAGHEERAWRFRLRAADSLARISSRAMYFRQADVMAILYNANRDMERATRNVEQASRLFAQHGEPLLAERVAGWREYIY